MPRDLAIGNGRLLVTFDATYTLRDVYYPHVGKENQTIGNLCRTGAWVYGRFAWFSDDGWSRSVRYRPDSLVSNVTIEHAGLGLRIHGTDTVHPEKTLLLRRFDVTNLSGSLREVRLFFHHNVHIMETEIGDTAMFEPVNRFVIHYKRNRYILINGRTGDGQGIFQYATGQKGTETLQGTWRDAEDGWLEMTPISQGAVDSTVSFRQNIAAGATARFYVWVALEESYWTVKELDSFVLTGSPVRKVGRVSDEHLAIESMFEAADRESRDWVARARCDFADLPEPIREQFRRSLLVVRTQIDRDGAIIAANDGDSMATNRDTYSYMWPRDGALVARTLDRAGYHELTEKFFRFCTRLMPGPSYYPDGYLLHKFHADGTVGSSWHPWVRDGRPSLPVQEDETALVLWAFWRHFLDRAGSGRAAYDLVRELAPRLVVPAARFMLIYRDEPAGRERFRTPFVHPSTGLPLASYDLWEERYGIHAFTVAATIAGLRACSELLSLVVNESWALDRAWSEQAAIVSDERTSPTDWQGQIIDLAEQCDVAAQRMKSAFHQHLWSPERHSFGRMLNFGPNGERWLDATFDASTLYALIAFDVFSPDDPGVRDTLYAIEQRLWCKTAIGGIARYENDYYHRKSDDIANVPGSPWFICTLWGALGHIFRATDRSQLHRPLEILEWVCNHAQPSGVLAEQVHPYTGAPMSVAPLTWSHATFVETVLAYCEKLQSLGR
jgi:GH15 family glucan-1,4-alpha-glucosidase